MISAVLNPNSRCDELISEFWQDCRPARLRSVGEWAEAELILPSGPAEGLRYRLNRVPYARLLLNELGKWQRQVITGPTQSGKSLNAFVLLILYYVFEVKVDVVVGVPDLGMAGVKWEKDIKPLIEASRYRHLIPRKGPGSQGGKPVLIKFLNGKTIEFKGGGGNDKQRAGSTGKVLLITETDGLDEVSKSSKEGQNKIDQLEGRVKSFGLDGLVSMECTVTTDTGRTWQEYIRGTQSRIACKCVHCGHYVSPEREHLVGWDTADNVIDAGLKAAFSCPDCGELINDAQRRQMNQDSVLVHRGQEITPEGQIVGDPPKTDTLGFRWSAFNNLLTPIEILGREEWTAERAENPVAAEIRLKQQVWCIPANEEKKSKDPLTIPIVRGSDAKYFGRLNRRKMWERPEWCEWITAHVDIGLRVLNWSVNAHGSKGIRDVIAYGATATEQPDQIGAEEAILLGLHRVREIIERNCDLTLGLVDCGYQGNKKEKNPRRVAYEFVLSCGSHWQGAIGLPAWNRRAESDECEPSLNGDPWYFSMQDYLSQTLWIVDFDPNHFKHAINSSYLIIPQDKDQNRVAGSVTLFGADPKAHNDFAVQMNNERFEIDHKTGKSKWVRHGHNHFMDNEVGNLVARSVIDSIELSRKQVASTPAQAPAFTTPDGRAFFAGNR